MKGSHTEEWPALSQSPEHFPAAQAPKIAAAVAATAAAASDRSYCSTKAQGSSQFAAANHVADADTDAAVVSHEYCSARSNSSKAQYQEPKGNREGSSS